jgi:hypothetical protein
MFKEMQYVDHSLRAVDLAEKMAERRNQLLSTPRRPSPVVRMVRMLFAPAVTTESYQVESTGSKK